MKRRDFIKGIGVSVSSSMLAGGCRSIPEADLPRYPIRSNLFFTPETLSVERFTPGRETPGNVGICFSGGGTYALVGALGQMRALRHLGCLGKARAISSVSGGSWATVPFTFLPDSISDDDFLGGYVADPGELTLNPFHGNRAAVLGHMSPNNLGRVPASHRMSDTSLFLRALELSAAGCPKGRIWTHIVGENILKPFGLAGFRGFLPQSFFAHNEAHGREILAANPGLPGHFHTYHSRAGDTPRSLHVCNTGQFIRTNPGNSSPSGADLVAPVQATAFYTGILGRGQGKDAAGLQVGGGGVPSFAFNSELTGRRGIGFRGEQAAPLALSDITGMSSAFFATGLAERHPKLKALDPTYTTWPVHAEPEAGVPNRFSDGGGVEDNGVASILAFRDIEKLVVFINTPGDPMGPLHEDIFVDPWLPTLFGYRPLLDEAPRRRYELYSQSHPTGTDPDRFWQHNQVFPAERLSEVVRGLWERSGKESRRRPAAFLQRDLPVVDNSWFGVRGAGRRIDVLWVKTGPVEEWREQLRASVRARTDPMFPGFKLKQTHLSKFDVNLFAHMTSWVAAQQQEELSELFR